MGIHECKVEINEQKWDSTIRVSVRDNGEGIPPETRDRIFVPEFYHQILGYRTWLSNV